ncbi:CDP-glucose 4,6-dehydratase [Candidatus Deianiraea vastatrix]|uniref:CDP-glucose 4,6-dehydratase n=1 Tax=Candidatus Deianiraea vastatrix TaxID=2163644 RepID=A0A5B8XF26_9RICK|nr:CDP-glucose 4,6-dehydratase [Candidatus Deianiraea vastatrix]QED23892.1 CDP-glucose 4,6-dehydratase [Candidatus Deianiraea vastatrix]
MQNFYKDKRIFLTGHTGFKGAWLALILHKMGAKVFGFSLEPQDIRGNLYNILNIENTIEKSYIGDICNLEELKKAYEESRPDIVFHLAAQPFVLRSYKNPIETYQTNIIGLANLFETIRNSSHLPKVVLNVTTDKCYENKEWHYPYRENEPLGGHDPYSASKAMAEILTTSYRKSFFQDGKTKIITARGGNVIGGGDFGENRIIPDLIQSIENNTTLEIRNPNSIRPWQYIFDVLSGYMTFVKYAFEQDNLEMTSLNIGPENTNETNTITLVSNMIDAIGKGKFEVKKGDFHHEAHYLKLDISLAKCVLNWKPKYCTQEMISQTAKWYKSYINKEDINTISYNMIEDFFAL